jgi:truncated hemoglobin YjbI
MKPNPEKVFDQIGIKREAIKSLEQLFYDKRGKNPLIIAEVVQI